MSSWSVPSLSLFFIFQRSPARSASREAFTSKQFVILFFNVDTTSAHACDYLGLSAPKSEASISNNTFRKNIIKSIYFVSYNNNGYTMSQSGWMVIRLPFSPKVIFFPFFIYFFKYIYCVKSCRCYCVV